MHPDVATANSWSQGTSNTHIPTFESPLTPSAAHHLPAAPPPWRSLQGMQRRRQERPPPCRQPDSGLHYPLRQHAPRSSKRSLRCAHRTNPAGGALAGRPASSSSASQNCRLINSSSGSSAGRAVASRAQASAALPQSSSSWQPDMFRNNDSNLCDGIMTSHSVVVKSQNEVRRHQPGRKLCQVSPSPSITSAVATAASAAAAAAICRQACLCTRQSARLHASLQKAHGAAAGALP